jgi:DNA-binding transcriptional LysR family regulator
MEVLPEMARTVLHRMRPHILLPADHSMADQPTVSLRDLEPEPMVLLDAPPSSHNTLAIYDRFGVVPNVRYRPTTFEVTRALVGRGMGYALLVQRPANDRTYEGCQVVIKEIAEPVGGAAVLLTWPRVVRLNKRAQEFIRYCEESASGGQPLTAL